MLIKSVARGERRMCLVVSGARSRHLPSPPSPMPFHSSPPSARLRLPLPSPIANTAAFADARPPLETLRRSPSAAWRVVWAAISADANKLQNGHDVSRLALWPTDTPDWFTKAHAQNAAIWDKDRETWDFWRRWWDGVIAGTPLPFDLLDAVASIENSAFGKRGQRRWRGEIKAIEMRFVPGPDGKSCYGDQVLDRALRKLPPPRTPQLQQYRQAVIAHRAALLENFDALLGFIALEI
ncbi:MAG: hypothetical protein U5N55_13970 [Cypionkella sp.]|nr:hypothetical protein [Cypionkella sp.]